jgi:hypothetical protein
VANADQPAAYGNPLNAERLRIAVQNNLAAKGIQPAADRSTADGAVIGAADGAVGDAAATVGAAVSMTARGPRPRPASPSISLIIVRTSPFGMRLRVRTPPNYPAPRRSSTSTQRPPRSSASCRWWAVRRLDGLDTVEQKVDGGEQFAAILREAEDRRV